MKALSALKRIKVMLSKNAFVHLSIVLLRRLEFNLIVVFLTLQWFIPIRAGSGGRVYMKPLRYICCGVYLLSVTCCEAVTFGC